MVESQEKQLCKLTKSERETVIRWDMNEKTAHVYTAIPSVINIIDELCKMYPDVYKCIDNDTTYGAKQYTFDSRYIGFKKPLSERKYEAVTANLLKSLSC